MKEGTVGSEFEGKREDVILKLLSLLQIKMYSGQKIFNELAVFEKHFRRRCSVNVCPLVVALPSACYALQKIRSESYRWCRILWLCNTGDSMAWCCLDMRHLSKRPAHHRVANSNLFCMTTESRFSLFVQKQSHSSVVALFCLHIWLTVSGNNSVVKPWRSWSERRVRFSWSFLQWRHSWEPQLCSAGRFLSQF